MTKLPDRPWNTVEIDLCGPFKGTEYTLVIIPQVVQSDNGPPFNSVEFERFESEAGFKHKKVTPRHPKVQGQVEAFNKLINKTAAIAYETGQDLHEATYDMLQGYRQTPHPATNVTPYQLLMNRQVRTKLDHFPT